MLLKPLSRGAVALTCEVTGRRKPAHLLIRRSTRGVPTYAGNRKLYSKADLLRGPIIVVGLVPPILAGYMYPHATWRDWLFSAQMHQFWLESFLTD